MRFQVGKLYPFILIEYVVNVPRLSKYYVPWEDKLVTLQVKMLECQEHVRVPFQGQTEPEHDGFIFKGLTAGQWFNQYPTFYDDQLSAMDCWIVREDFNPSAENPRKMIPVSKYLEILKDGIMNLHEKGRQDHAQQLEAHFKTIELELLTKHRLKTVISPLVWQDDKGKKRTSPTIVQIAFEQSTD